MRGCVRGLQLLPEIPFRRTVSGCSTPTHTAHRAGLATVEPCGRTDSPDPTPTRRYSGQPRPYTCPQVLRTGVRFALKRGRPPCSQDGLRASSRCRETLPSFLPQRLKFVSCRDHSSGVSRQSEVGTHHAGNRAWGDRSTEPRDSSFPHITHHQPPGARLHQGAGGCLPPAAGSLREEATATNNEEDRPKDATVGSTWHPVP